MIRDLGLFLYIYIRYFLVFWLFLVGVLRMGCGKIIVYKVGLVLFIFLGFLELYGFSG